METYTKALSKIGNTTESVNSSPITTLSSMKVISSKAKCKEKQSLSIQMVSNMRVNSRMVKSQEEDTSGGMIGTLTRENT